MVAIKSLLDCANESTTYDVRIFHRGLSFENIYSNKEFCEAKSKPAIIHYAGYSGKHWRMWNSYKDCNFYLEESPKALKFYTFRDVRKKLFSKV